MDLKSQQSLRSLLPLFLVIFIDTVGYFIVLPVVIRIFIHGAGGIVPSNATQAYRDFMYSLVLMLSPLAFIIFSPIAGHFSDRIGRKKVLIYALIAAMLGFALPIIGILKKSISLIFIGRAIAGASSSSQPIAQAAVTDFTTGKSRAFYLSMIGFCMTLGMVVGPLAGSYLSDTHLNLGFNVTTPYWFALILSIINIILIKVCYSNTTQIKAKTDRLAFTQSLKKFTRLITINKIWVLFLAFFFMEISWAQYYQSSFLILAQRFHYTTNLISIFVAYVGIWMCLGLSVIYKALTRRFEISTIANISLLVTCISLLLCNIPNAIAQWLFMIPGTIAIGTAYPSLLSLMSQKTTADHQGYILGCASTFLGVAWMITGLLSGPLASTWFGASTLLATASIALSLCIYQLSS